MSAPQEWDVYREPRVLHPGKPLGRVRASDRLAASKAAAIAFPGLLVSVSAVSPSVSRLERALRRLGRMPAPVRYEQRGEA
jgi:hypothetical protein